jgi:AraC-like DNA-binding protein
LDVGVQLDSTQGQCSVARAEPIPVFRAAHLLPYLTVLREAGVPWDAELRRARLPGSFADKPDTYLPLLRVLRFLAACERGVEDLALRGTQRLGSDQLSASGVRALGGAPTLRTALQSLHEVVGIEATRLLWRMDSGRTVRLCAHAAISREAKGRHFVEWHQNIALVKLVRAYAGPEWRPDAMAFESDIAVTRHARELFPETRFLTRQRSCWISVPCGLLSLPASDTRRRAARLGERAASLPPVRDFVDSLRALLKTYLAEGAPTIMSAADIADTSVRTLQRRLARAGMCYSDLLDEIRFEAAEQLLTDSASDVSEIAYELGYAEASSFSRAFRRLAGLSPRQYRHAQIVRYRSESLDSQVPPG